MSFSFVRFVFAFRKISDALKASPRVRGEPALQHRILAAVFTSESSAVGGLASKDLTLAREVRTGFVVCVTFALCLERAGRSYY